MSLRRLALLVALALPTVTPAVAQDPATHMQHMSGVAPAAPAAAMPTQPGQAAFATIQEIVEILEADPATDWSKIDVEALRRHLVDMDAVTLRAEAKAEPIADGMRFVATGPGTVADSVRRMVTAHAATMNGVDGWRFEAQPTETGAVLTVRTPAKDVPKLRGLGFVGVMVRGMHHQAHHLMIARGGDPHR